MRPAPTNPRAVSLPAPGPGAPVPTMYRNYAVEITALGRAALAAANESDARARFIADVDRIAAEHGDACAWCLAPIEAAHGVEIIGDRIVHAGAWDVTGPDCAAQFRREFWPAGGE